MGARGPSGCPPCCIAGQWFEDALPSAAVFRRVPRRLLRKGVKKSSVAIRAFSYFWHLPPRLALPWLFVSSFSSSDHHSGSLVAVRNGLVALVSAKRESGLGHVLTVRFAKRLRRQSSCRTTATCVQQRRRGCRISCSTTEMPGTWRLPCK